MYPHVMLTTIRNATRALHPQTFIPYTHQNLSIMSLLLTHGFLSSVTLGSSQHAHPSAFRDAPLPARMLIASLKYRGDRSVIGRLDCVSTPKRPIHVSCEELDLLAKGKRVKGVKGAGLGELIFVRSGGSKEWFEARDAVRQKLGGEVMVRVGSE